MSKRQEEEWGRRGLIKAVWKHDIRMDGMQAIFLQKFTHPTQSHVKVHSMSILTGSLDQKFWVK